LWFWDEYKVQCEDCLKFQKDKAGSFANVDCKGINFVDECKHPSKIVPKLSRLNKDFFDFFTQVIPWLGNGMGGFQLSAVREFCDMNGTPQSIRPWILNRCTIMVNAYNKTKEKNKK